MDELRIRLNSDKSTDSEELYRNCLPFFSRWKLFSPLENGSFVEFHEKLTRLASMPHGVGLSVGVMAQINIAGFVLKKSAMSHDVLSGRILQEIISGEKVVSFGVSERNWNGRLSGLKSTVSLNLGEYTLNAEKSFLTNGFQSDYFLVLVKENHFGEYRVVLVDRFSKGVEVEKFSLPFAVEATHARLWCKEVKVFKEQILPFEYKKYAEGLRLSEILSLVFVFCGFARFLLQEIVKQKGGLEDFSDREGKICRIYTLINLLYCNAMDISKRKDENYELNLLEFFPFGYEDISEIVLKDLETLCDTDSLNFLFNKDVGLFRWRDSLHLGYMRKTTVRILREIRSGLLEIR